MYGEHTKKFPYLDVPMNSFFTPKPTRDGPVDDRRNYPKQPIIDPYCTENTKYKTMPPDSPNGLPNYKGPEGWGPESENTSGWPYYETTRGPSTIKSLYTGIPNYYPPMRIIRPIDTMYMGDISQYNDIGQREAYRYKVYPLHHHHVRERRVYSDTIHIRPNIATATQYPVVKEGTIEYTHLPEFAMP